MAPPLSGPARKRMDPNQHKSSAEVNPSLLGFCLCFYADDGMPDVMTKQEPGATFVLVTDDDLHRPPIWQQVIEQHHGTPCQIIRYAASGVLSRRLRGLNIDAYNQRGDKFHLPKPLYNIYCSGELSLVFEKPVLGTDALIDRHRAQSQKLVTEETGVRASGIASKDDETLSLQHDAQSVATEPAVAQASRISPNDEDKVVLDVTPVAVPERAIGKKGDDFLHFLERALALYEKI